MEGQDIFLRGLVRWLGFPLTTIPYTRGTRQSGDSKFSAARMVELALSGIAAHSLRPLRFAIWLALGFALLSVLFIVYAIVSFLFVQHTVAGWSSLIAVIAILGAAQLLVLGIVGEYVGRILRETMKISANIIRSLQCGVSPITVARHCWRFKRRWRRRPPAQIVLYPPSAITIVPVT